jgi:hypothetical protein
VPDSATGTPTKPAVFATDTPSRPESVRSDATSTKPPATSAEERAHKFSIFTRLPRSCSTPRSSSKRVVPPAPLLPVRSPTLDRSTPW